MNSATKRICNQYMPDYVSLPGETLLERLGELGMSQAELSLQIGYSPRAISKIVRGRAAITTEIALQLERVLDVPANFWINRQKQYLEWQASGKISNTLD